MVMKKLKGTVLITLIAFFLFVPEIVFSQGLEIPACPPLDVIDHNWFKLKYSSTHNQPEWVAYELTREELEGDAERSSGFRKDPLVAGGTASSSDYTHSGCDRGHLIPAADLKMSEQSMKESFFMSNVSPQLPSFNRGIWLELESCVRTWAWRNESLYIATGPVLTDDSYRKIGKTTKVSVPEYFFKALLDYTEPELKMIGFLLPNREGEMPLAFYACSIDTLERETGIDFFPMLPDDIEDRLEAEFDIEKWPFKRFN